MEGSHKTKQSGFKKSKQKTASTSKEMAINNSASTAQPEGRRQLRTLELTPPDFKVDRQILIDSYIDIEVKYLGELNDIPFGLDPTKRTEILRHIDAARKQGTLPWNIQSSHYDAVIRLSARQINVIRNEAIIRRAYIHNIVAVSYVRDDAQHLVIMQTAENQQENCELVIWECVSKEKSEEICAVVHQIFEVVYTEMTMKQFDNSLSEAARTESLRSTPSIHQRPSLPEPYPNPQSNHQSHMEYPTTEPSSNSAEIISVTAKVLLQDYIEELRKKLNGEELQQFASILKEYRQFGSIDGFCASLQRLYGRDRMSLFPDMRPYIPEKDMDFFEDFLSRHNLQEPESTRSRRRRRQSEDSSSSTIDEGGGGPYTPSLPDEPIPDEHDMALDDLVEQVNHLEAIIDS